MATEKRLIDANALAKEIDYEYDLGYGEILTDPRRFAEMVEDAPAVDVVEVVHGRWIDRYGGKYANPLYECSECKNPAPTKCEYDVLGSLEWKYDLTPYCPNCGAKMDGDGNV